MSDYLLADLNESQKKAVTAENHHLLVLAGAGSGKTRVLTYRLAWLLANRKVGSDQIIAVTFTNKASKEMIARIQALESFKSYGFFRFRKMWLGTFHGICNRFLRLHAKEAGLSNNFQIIDMNDQLSVIKQVAEKNDIDLERYQPRDLQYFINARKEEGLRAGDGDIFDDDAQIKDNFFDDYDKYLNKENLADFPELLLRAYEVLKRNEIIREHYQQRFAHILVDEFQDTNLLQYKLIKLISGEQTSIFAVGDDDQSIYSFRGARVENMRDFEIKFAKKNVIRLEQNYRSTSVILSAANKLISNNNSRLGKNLWTDNSQSEPIIIYSAPDDQNEAKWIIAQMQTLSHEGIPWSQMTILYRINAHSRGFEHQAIQAGIPYRIYGGFRFYDRAEIKNLLAYLRLLVNPDDELSFLRVVNFPPRAIGEKTINKLKEIAFEKNISLMQAVSYVDGRGGIALTDFAKLINSIREQINGCDLIEIIKIIIQQSNISEYYQNQRDGNERLENIEELVNAATQYLGELNNFQDQTENINQKSEGEINNKEENLITGLEIVNKFLADAILDAAEPESSDKSAINMMSVHSAKGLEFEVVFIAGLEHGTFPHEFNLDLEEERRLMYVAITRSKKYLRLSYAHQRMLHGRIRYNIPSVFINELPGNLIQNDSLSIGHENPRLNYFKTDLQQFNFKSKILKKGTFDNLNEKQHKNKLPDFAIGSRVKHRKFGEGFVEKYEGGGDDIRVLISFGTLGQKWLLMKLAKLEAV